MERIPFACGPIPIFAIDFRKLQKDYQTHYDFYIYKGWRVRIFEVTGTIVSISRKSSYILYDVDDHTGTITIYQNVEGKDSEKISTECDQFSLGTLICIRGIVTHFQRARCLKFLTQVEVQHPDVETEAICHTLMIRSQLSPPSLFSPSLSLETQILEMVYSHPQEKILATNLCKEKALLELALKISHKEPPEFTISRVIRQLEQREQVYICYKSNQIGAPFFKTRDAVS